ncbi:MBL fold metallo-hydrolase [Nostoc sp. FACHB-152]|uniref:MBL fold metallo-hydrolase n=1 Tax=unclassified Nostoc TaxID=2593658 RepID=UPI00168842C9|nr:MULTISPECIES: MBL fold metallo-hydrolase [unclassified Nostoc]MBD2451008.1 MBL fold metallo-hydrolase [Nostoc sp. FACHB-152]MBD2472076.1 MBL fold metallo-hydrolase [Nostoc sp. FACHB-145]
MRVTICGHAALHIETIDQRILLDPCFSDELVGGTLTYHPGRVFDLDKLPNLTAIVVTHGHFDHFHRETLEKLPRELPVITADEPELLAQLQQMGFYHVIVCQPWQAIALGQTHLLPTPSDHEEPEFGLVVRDATGTFWHMADAEVTVEIGDRLTQAYGGIDLISTKYQPVVRASMGYQHGMGATFDREGVVSWLEAACACNPALIFPYASGLCFSGRHAWFNRYAFPLSAEETVRLLQHRLGSPERATTVRPGDVIELQAGQHPQRHEQAADFVKAKRSPKLRWEPVDISTLTGLSTVEARRTLQQQLEVLLTQKLIPWLKQIVTRTDTVWAKFPSEQVVWQLVVHTGEEQRLNYAIDFRAPDFCVVSGEHPEANFFTHIAGQALAEVMTGKKPGLIFWLAGEVRSYEKVICIRNGHFEAPQWPNIPEDFPSDPLTFYLRHFGAETIPLEELETLNSSENPDDIQILTRLGENDGVISKKVLLAYLAVKEAERLGLNISDAEIQAMSDSFREQCDLQDSQATEQWLKEAGLSLEAYSAVMRDFTAVLKLEQHYTSVIEPWLANHRRVATARYARSRRDSVNNE